VDHYTPEQLDQVVDNLAEVVVPAIPVPERHIPVAVVEHIQHTVEELELGRAQARASYIQLEATVEGTDTPVVELEDDIPVEQQSDLLNELERLEHHIRNSHKGSLRQVVVDQLEVEQGLEELHIRQIEVDQ